MNGEFKGGLEIIFFFEAYEVDGNARHGKTGACLKKSISSKVFTAQQLHKPRKRKLSFFLNHDRSVVVATVCLLLLLLLLLLPSLLFMQCRYC